jgi:hypothetical protein
VLFLTMEQHQEVLKRLRDLGRNHADRIPYHSAGIEYTSLMLCFFLHNLSVAETLLRLADSFDHAWFPVTIGYTITRTIFETDINAHYITKDPVDRARSYIEFGCILNKNKMDAYSKHKKSKDPQWREAMSLVWENHWALRECGVIEKFNAVVPKFTNKKGKQTIYRNWSGKSLRQMAVDVDHEEAYDIFYAELSSFAHVDVHHSDRFLQNQADGPTWSQRAEESDVGNVFRYAASFYTCFLELFGSQFNTWPEAAVKNCWKV